VLAALGLIGDVDQAAALAAPAVLGQELVPERVAFGAPGHEVLAGAEGYLPGVLVTGAAPDSPVAP
jgi:hypothetical protein